MIALLSAFLLAGPTPTVDAFLAAVNAERARRRLAAVQISKSLMTLAEERAAEIGASETLDFQPMPGEDGLARAKAAGYRAMLVQELDSVEGGDPGSIVETWVASLGGSDAFLRHEARDIGVGEGALQGQPVRVLIVGVRATEDPERKRLPGVAPREWLTSDLFNLANRKRNEAGYPSFDRSDALDTEAQKMAESLLSASEASAEGVRAAKGGGSILFFKATGRWKVADIRNPVDAWFKRQREIGLMAGRAVAGAGLASRGEDENLVAVWTLAIRPRR